MRYFSYGLTVSEYEMDQACPGAKLIGHATLMCHEMRFAGSVDAILNLQHSVEGVLWEIDEDYIDMITAYERHDSKRQMMVRQGKDIMRAWVSFKKPGTAPKQPEWDYWQELDSAYDQAGLPFDVLEKAVEITEYYIDINQKY